MNEKQLKVIRELWRWNGSFEDLCLTVADHVAAAEKQYDTPFLDHQYILDSFYQMLVTHKFSPNTPTWINAGRTTNGSLSACYVKDIQDNIESILDASRWAAMVQKWGGGTGFNLSNLRAKGASINSTHGKACGPIRVLKYLASTSQMITQGGARDGANMAVMSVYHPDVLEFINLKSRESKFLLEIPKQIAQEKVDAKIWTLEEAEEWIEYCKLQGGYQLFNVSVAVDKAFMENIIRFYEHNTNPKEVDWSPNLLPCGQTDIDVWNAITTQAWQSGDPGLLFLERAQAIGAIHSPFILPASNPCGEQLLPDNGSCNLGSVNLAKMIAYTNDGIPYIRWQEFADVIRLGVRFLDNVVTVNKHPLPEIDEVNQAERRIGLGIMGWADVLLAFGYPYESNEAYELAVRVAAFFQETAHQASIDLANARGPFPLWDQVKNNRIDESKLGYSGYKMHLKNCKPRRNATVTTIAPTGTISIVADCSSGIEPHYMLKYVHQGMAKSGGLGLIWASDTVRQMFEYYNTEEELEEAIKNSSWKPANEISIEAHIKHQSIYQDQIDNAISKTINLPNSATVQDIARAYMLAWTSGCKGSTVYRDGCKPFQVLNAPSSKKENQSNPVCIEAQTPLTYPVASKMPRPAIMPGYIWKIETAEGDLWVTVTYDESKMPFEIFCQLGKGGNSACGFTEGISRVVSTALRHRIPPVELIKQLRGIRTTPMGFGEKQVLSVPDGIGRALEFYMVKVFGPDWGAKDGWLPKVTSTEIQNTIVESNEVITEACPNCGSQLQHIGGCRGGSCMQCGYSKCG